VIPAGRYRVSANGKNYHLSFNDLINTTIVADSVEMICTETVQAIQINNYTNFRLQGIAVDYDPLPFTQGRIVEMSADKRILTADFLDGYSTTVRGDKLEAYDSISGELSTATYYGVTYQIDTENREIVLTKPFNYQLANSHEKRGDIVVLGSQNTRYIPHAIVPSGCTGLELEDVRLYSGTTFGFFEQNCSSSQYFNCRIEPRPLSTEVAERGVRHMRSINADGFHSKHATAGSKYIGCVARYNGDDGIAINGDYHVVTGFDGNILRVVGKAGNTPNLKVGDMAELVSYTGERLADALITEIDAGSSLTSEEKQFLQNQTFYGGAANTYKAIKLSPEYVWLKAGSGNNITISDNVISGCYSAAIALTSIRGLLLEINTIEDTNNDLLVPWIMNNYGRNEDPSREIYMKTVVRSRGPGVRIPLPPHLQQNPHAKRAGFCLAVSIKSLLLEAI
jgi:hypothetical protein